jgi:hypothetical protein
VSLQKPSFLRVVFVSFSEFQLRYFNKFLFSPFLIYFKK